MANGYHLFSTGEVLTAANVNDYLMKQTVMIFASASARTTALSGVLREGMLSYRLDAHVLEVYNGTIWEAPETNLTTKGDLATFDTAPTRLAVGSDGQTLVADSSTSSGLRYQVPVNCNPVINSSMQVWARGTSISLAASTNAYTADRWQLFTQANEAATVSRQTTNDTTNLPFIQYCARLQRNSGQTGTAQMSFIQGLETINSVPYAGKTVTMSFYARAGANFSPTSNAFNAMIYTGTGTDQFPTGYTGGASVGLTTFNITTTWVRYSITGTIPTTATEFGTYFYWVPTGTAGTNDYVEITGVQVEVGSVATPFKTYAGTLQGELAACQRYYWRYGATGGYVYAGFGSGSAASTTQATIIVQNPVPMRVAATSIDGSTLALTDGVNAAVSVTSTTLAQVNELQNAILANVASGLTQYRWYRLASNNSANGYLGFSAEL